LRKQNQSKKPPSRDVLLVEDHANFRKTLRSILSAIPVNVLEAATAKAALQIIEPACPRLIFMDLKLPDGNGFQLTRTIKSRYPDAMVAVLSNHDIEEYREEAFECGADRFLSKKSFTAADIISLVKSIFDIE